MKIKVFYGNQPCLEEKNGMGLNRDRNPDSGWGEMRNTRIESAKEIEMNKDIRKILLEDIAFHYGKNSAEFSRKLEEFNLI